MTADRGAKVAAPSNTIDVAVSLAKVGWPVFPVTIYEAPDGKRSKVPAVPKGTSWKDWATTDEAKIRAEWRRGCWIGVYAGAAGIVVLDVDPGGDDSLAAKGLTPPDTFTYPTQREGARHHVYAAPEGIDLTITAGLVYEGERLEGIDIRAGGGLMVYYGPALRKAPKLTAAPDWMLVTKAQGGASGADGVDRAPSADEDALRARLADGIPSPEVQAALETITSEGMQHPDMLAAVTELVRLGVKGHPGVAEALDAGRETYSRGWPDAGRHWDNALQGSIRRLGLPPETLALSKAERKEIKKRNKPEAIEKAKTRQKAAPVASNDTTSSGRILEDGPLAEDLHPTLARTWAYAKGRGLMRFDGKVWCAAEERVLEDDVRLLLVEIAEEELRLAAQRMDKPAVAKATTLFSRTRAVNVAKFVVGMLAKSEPTFDAHPDLLNVQNGVVDLRTSELAPHDPALYFTNIAGAKYKPGAAHPDVSTMLKALDRPVREWLQIRAGNAATGYQPDDTAIMTLEGGGANGKSTVNNAVKAALGTYARTAPEKLLLPSRGDHSTELATIAGARLVIVEELPEGRHVNAKRVKDLAGTGTLTARLLYQDNFEFVPVHATWISTNYTLQLSEVDEGTWRRFERVVFPYKYVDEPSAPHERKKDRGLVGRLLAGRAGRSEAVLAWIVEGARLWYENGREIPAPPEAVAKAKIEWRSQTDLVMAFAAERLTFDADDTVTSKGMADAFSSWLFNNGHPAWSHQTITARLEGHDLFARNRVRLDRPRIEGKRVRAWVGVGLRPNEAVLDSFIASAHK